LRHALTREEVGSSAQTPDFGSILFEEGSKPWPVQTSVAKPGYRARRTFHPAARQRTVLKTSGGGVVSAHASLQASGNEHWTIATAGIECSAPVTVDATAIQSPRSTPEIGSPPPYPEQF